MSLATGIPVHLDTILAISSSVTHSCTSERSFSLTFFSSSASSFSRAGSLPYWSSAAFSRLYSRLANCICLLTSSISSRRWLKRSTEAFSLSHLALPALNSSLSPASSSCSSARRFLLTSSVSFLRAASSISSCMTLRDNSSSSAGMESSSVLISAQASSTRSMALSGRNLSEIYLCESSAAATSALSAILTPWKTSYLSFSPRSIEMVSSTDGSSTITGWKRLSRAASFSIYLRYSSSVVAPMQ